MSVNDVDATEFKVSALDPDPRWPLTNGWYNAAAARTYRGSKHQIKTEMEKSIKNDSDLAPYHAMAASPICTERIIAQNFPIAGENRAFIMTHESPKLRLFMLRENRYKHLHKHVCPYHLFEMCHLIVEGKTEEGHPASLTYHTLTALIHPEHKDRFVLLQILGTLKEDNEYKLHFLVYDHLMDQSMIHSKHDFILECYSDYTVPFDATRKHFYMDEFAKYFRYNSDPEKKWPADTKETPGWRELILAEVKRTKVRAPPSADDESDSSSSSEGEGENEDEEEGEEASHSHTRRDRLRKSDSDIDYDSSNSSDEDSDSSSDEDDDEEEEGYGHKMNQALANYVERKPMLHSDTGSTFKKKRRVAQRERQLDEDQFNYIYKLELKKHQLRMDMMLQENEANCQAMIRRAEAKYEAAKYRLKIREMEQEQRLKHGEGENANKNGNHKRAREEE